MDSRAAIPLLHTLCIALLIGRGCETMFSGSGDESLTPMSGSGSGEPEFNASVVCDVLVAVNTTVEQSAGTVSIEVNLLVGDVASNISLVSIEQLTPSNVAVIGAVNTTTLILELGNTILTSDTVQVFRVFLSLQQLDTSAFGECSFDISVTFQVADICAPGSTLPPIDDIIMERATFLLELGISAEMVMEFAMSIREFLSTEFTERCIANCALCSLTSNCAEYFISCGGFGLDNVNLGEATPISVTDPTRKRRQDDNSTTIGETSTVEIFITIPAGASALLLDTGFPLVPALSAVNIVINTTEELEDATGLAVIGLPEVLIPPTTVPTTVATTPPPAAPPVAIIVVPIVVALLVIGMVAGIAITLAVTYVIKMKKRAKVLPEGGHQQQQPTQGLRANAKVEVVEEVEDA